MRRRVDVFMSSSGWDHRQPSNGLSITQSPLLNVFWGSHFFDFSLQNLRQKSVIVFLTVLRTVTENLILTPKTTHCMHTVRCCYYSMLPLEWRLSYVKTLYVVHFACVLIWHRAICTWLQSFHVTKPPVQNTAPIFCRPSKVSAIGLWRNEQLLQRKSSQSTPMARKGRQSQCNHRCVKFSSSPPCLHSKGCYTVSIKLLHTLAYTVSITLTYITYFLFVCFSLFVK